MYMKFKILLLLVLLNISVSQTFDEFKVEMEGKVRNVAQQMTNLFANRCDQKIVQCEIKSYNQCEGTDQKICYQDFPKSPACLDDQISLSQTSATRFPNNVDVNLLSEQERHFVCTSAALQPTFNDLNSGRDKRYGSAFVGSSFGSIRTYPTSKQCFDYDPRFRPWYVAATSGGKNVIVVIDTSGSMSGSRMSLAVQAGKSVVNTLSNSDFVGVVRFSNAAETLVSQKITRATISHKESLLSSIGGLGSGGGTNYQQAFRKAFQMFDLAVSDQFGSPCSNSQNIILFLTDGYPSTGFDQYSQISGLIDQLNRHNVRIFTYALGSNANNALLQQIACRYDGISFKAEDSASGSQLTSLMRSYYIYVSEGSTITNPVWTEPYEDAFGFGRLVTVSMPIYYTEGSIRKILGVAGIDVSITKIQSFGFENQTEITKKLISESICLVSTLTDCDLQNLRPSDAKCDVPGCSSSSTSIAGCGTATPTNIFLTPVSTDENICCGLSVGGLVGIVIGSVVFIAIIVAVSVCCYKSRNP